MPTPARPAMMPRAESTSERPHDTAVREVSSRELLGSSNELLIRHQGSLYRLRITRQDKLILYK